MKIIRTSIPTNMGEGERFVRLLFGLVLVSSWLIERLPYGEFVAIAPIATGILRFCPIHAFFDRRFADRGRPAA